MIVYCATSNAGKLREFRLAAEAFPALAVEPLPGLAGIAPPEETGATFEENAIQKALYYGTHCDGYLFAEDSGLAVEALQGAPGIFSARYAGEGATDAANNALVLERMRGVAARAACFVCLAALVKAGRVEKTFQGVVEGVLLEEPRGTGGFGYDPLFYYPPYASTLAEVSGERKLAVSHRGKALRAMFAWLEKNAAPNR